MLTTKPWRKRRTKLVKKRRAGSGSKRKLSLRRRRRLLGRKTGHRTRYGRLRRRKKRLPAPVQQAENVLPAVPEPVHEVPPQRVPVDDPALYQQAYDEAYQEGFNSGFSKGFEDGHKLAYKNRV